MLAMPARFFGVVAVLVSCAALGQPSIVPQTVDIPSGALHLKAYLWVPPGPGRFPAVLFNHGRSDSAQYHWREGNLTLAGAARAIGPVFARHGYVLLFPFRRGEGPSADQGLSKPYALKIYPPVGKSSAEGHNFLYSNVSLWETDVFQFIGENMRP
jgi:hypothetical protein